MQVLMRRDLWLRDEGLTVLLGALLLMIFIVNPLAAAGVFRGYAALVHDLWLAFTVLSGVFAIGWRRKTAQVVVLARRSAVCFAGTWLRRRRGRSRAGRGRRVDHLSAFNSGADSRLADLS